MAAVDTNETLLRQDTVETLRDLWLNSPTGSESGGASSPTEKVSTVTIEGYDEFFEKRLQHTVSGEAIKNVTPSSTDWWLAMQSKSQKLAPIGTKRTEDMFRGTYDTGSGRLVSGGTTGKSRQIGSSQSTDSSGSFDRVESNSFLKEMHKDPLAYASQWEPSSGYSSEPASPPFQAKSSLSSECGTFSSALDSFADIVQLRGNSYVSGSRHFDPSNRKQFQLDPLQRLQQQKQEVAKEMLELERKKLQLETSERLYKQQLMNSMFEDNSEPSSPADRPLDFDYFEEVNEAVNQQKRSMLSCELIRSRSLQHVGEQLKSSVSTHFDESTMFNQRITRPSAYEEALELLENEAKSRRTLACVKNATCTWKGHIRPKQHTSPTYASKVFVGGLPNDVTSEMLSMIFSRFGASVQLPPRSRRHAYLVFENETQVHTLLRNCEFDGGEFSIYVPSLRGKGRKAQVIPWATEDSDWLVTDCVKPGSLETTSKQSSNGSRSHSLSSDESSSASSSSLVDDALQKSSQPDVNGFSKKNTVFVGALHGEITAEFLKNILTDLFGPIIHVGIHTDKNRYPNGSARVTFASAEAFRNAVLAEYVQVITPRFTKTIQLDAYIEDGPCCVCDMSTPVFCRHPDCFRYYCATCFNKHRALSDDYHPPVMRNRNGSDSAPMANSNCFNNNNNNHIPQNLMNNGGLSVFNPAGMGHCNRGMKAAY